MYTTATITNIAHEADGRVHLDITYTGNSGEIPIIRPIYVNTSTAPGPHELRGQAMSQLAILNTNRTVHQSLAEGIVLDTTTALPAPAAPRTTQYFMAASLPFTPGATPQDVFTITGSASKTISVLRMGVSTVQTTAGNNAWFVVKRSTANTGGTSAAVAMVPADSGFTAATATVLQYTANPTAGNLVGRVWSGRVSSPAPATATLGNLENVFLLSQLENPIILTGTAQVLALNFNGAALPAGLSVLASVWWREF